MRTRQDGRAIHRANLTSHLCSFPAHTNAHNAKLSHFEICAIKVLIYATLSATRHSNYSAFKLSKNNVPATILPLLMPLYFKPWCWSCGKPSADVADKVSFVFTFALILRRIFVFDFCTKLFIYFPFGVWVGLTLAKTGALTSFLTPQLFKTAIVPPPELHFVTSQPPRSCWQHKHCQWRVAAYHL